MRFTDCLKEQIALHSGIQMQDVLKLCYQAAFAAEHMLEDISAARAYFDAEFASVVPTDGRLMECISSDVCRVNLAVWKHMHLPQDWLFHMFQDSCTIHTKTDGAQAFDALTAEVGRMAKKGEMCFTAHDWEMYRAVYLRDGLRPVHHSDAYRQSEHPAYRIVYKELAALIPLLIKTATLPERSGARIIAIDGRAASGKTTRATQLESILNAGIIHMDDFFLPQDLRTPERLSEPGGNIHYERFMEEVLPRINKPDAFAYTVFDCEIMALSGQRNVCHSDIRIVEGAYSCHPLFNKYMDIKVMSDISAAEQKERILKRNGQGGWDHFASRWIPMEEAYLSTFHIREMADIVL